MEYLIQNYQVLIENPLYLATNKVIMGEFNLHYNIFFEVKDTEKGIFLFQKIKSSM